MSAHDIIMGAAGASGPATYIEDVFSTYLYTGNASGGVGTVDVVNNIDLSTKGGLVWIKPRSGAGGTDPHTLYDTVRGARYGLSSNLTDAQTYASVAGRELYQFNTTGFSVGPPQNYNVNQSAVPFVSWTFRKQPKFFDVVTYTGNGTTQNIAHSLGATPGCVIVKKTSNVDDWAVWHRTFANNEYAVLNSTAAKQSSNFVWNNTAPTSTQFSVGASGMTNDSATTYVAYLFAHDAGGFGLTGTDNVISCGSIVASGGLNDINLGFETQYVLLKKSSAIDDWYIYDTMRGMPVGNSGAPALEPNLSSAEANQLSVWPTATGFATNGLSGTYIYIAIRRGPMKVPTDGTKVFSPVLISDDNNYATTGFVTDGVLTAKRAGSTLNTLFGGRLTAEKTLTTSSTGAEAAWFSSNTWQSNTAVRTNSFGVTSSVIYGLQRAPSFFDEVCYTGTGSARTINHNLGVVPELMIVKSRVGTSDWLVYSSGIGATKRLQLNDTSASFTQSVAWNDTAPTSTVFTVGTSGAVNGSGSTYVAYLFATCAGVSKVTNFTGNGSSQTINCGFTAGARFVMIKRTDSTGDWYVWDTARGIVSGNDPHLSLNTTSAEVTTNDTIDTDSTGFIVNQVAATNCNVNGASYIVLAIA